MIEDFGVFVFNLFVVLYETVSAWPWQADAGIMIVLGVAAAVVRQLAGTRGTSRYTFCMLLVGLFGCTEGLVMLLLLRLAVKAFLPDLGVIVP